MSKSKEKAAAMTLSRTLAVESCGEAIVAELENRFDDMVSLYRGGREHFANTNEAEPLGSLRRWPQCSGSIQIPGQSQTQKQMREECSDLMSKILNDWSPGLPFSQESTPEEIKAAKGNFEKINPCGYTIINFKNKTQRMDGSMLSVDDMVFNVRFLGDKKDYSFYLREKDRPDVTILAFENAATPPRAFMIQNREDGKGTALELAKFSMIASAHDDDEPERSVFSVFNRSSCLYLDTPLLSHGLFDCCDEVTKSVGEETSEENTD